MARTGRPPVTDPRVHTIRYRVTEHEFATLTAAANQARTSVTDFARDRALWVPPPNMIRRELDVTVGAGESVSFGVGGQRTDLVAEPHVDAP